MLNDSPSQFCIDGTITTIQSNKECSLDNLYDKQKQTNELGVVYDLSEFINKPLSTSFRSCFFGITIFKKYQNENCSLFLYVKKTGTVYYNERFRVTKYNDYSHKLGSKEYCWLKARSWSWQDARKYCAGRYFGTLLTINSHEEYLSVLRACNIMNKRDSEGNIKINICSNPYIYIGLKVISLYTLEKSHKASFSSKMMSIYSILQYS